MRRTVEVADVLEDMGFAVPVDGWAGTHHQWHRYFDGCQPDDFGLVVLTADEYGAIHDAIDAWMDEQCGPRVEGDTEGGFGTRQRWGRDGIYEQGTWR